MWVGAGDEVTARSGAGRLLHDAAAPGGARGVGRAVPGHSPLTGYSFYVADTKQKLHPGTFNL